LGAPWTDNHHKRFNRSYICQAEVDTTISGHNRSPCLDVTRRDGELHYAVGPPYILHRDDLHRLSRTWTKFVPRVYEQYPFLLAEMYAYSMAAAHEKLPHITLRHYMISNTDADDEGWDWIDKLTHDDVCQTSENGNYLPNKILPTFVHYCQWFRMADIGFQKRRITKLKPFTCSGPMMLDLPKNLSTFNYVIKGDNSRHKISVIQAKRNTFTLCKIHDAINSAVEDYKQRSCENGNSNGNGYDREKASYRHVVNAAKNENW